jgi:hypothetical protein
MTNPHRRTVASAALTMTGCLLLAACGSSAPAAGAPTGVPAVQTRAGASTPATSVAPTDPASTDATPATDPSAGGNACSLVTEADATTALGTDPGPGTANTGAHDSSQCHYGPYQSKLVLVNITPTQGKLAYDNMRNNPNIGKTGSVVDVAGVGDKAFEVDSHGSAGIFFRKGDALVAVSVVFYLAASPPTDQVRALAKLVASRI